MAHMIAEVSKELERLRDLFYGLAELRDRLREAGVTWPRPLPEVGCGDCARQDGSAGDVEAGRHHGRD